MTTPVDKLPAEAVTTATSAPKTTYTKTEQAFGPKIAKRLITPPCSRESPGTEVLVSVYAYGKYPKMQFREVFFSANGTTSEIKTISFAPSDAIFILEAVPKLLQTSMNMTLGTETCQIKWDGSSAEIVRKYTDSNIDPKFIIINKPMMETLIEQPEYFISAMDKLEIDRLCAHEAVDTEHHRRKERIRRMVRESAAAVVPTTPSVIEQLRKQLGINKRATVDENNDAVKAESANMGNDFAKKT